MHFDWILGSYWFFEAKWSILVLINRQPHHVNLPPINQREIVLDIVGNMTQIASWTLKGFHREEERIALFLKLTRKDVNQLTRFPLPAPFVPIFTKFCKAYDDMEAEYKKGIKDHRVWAGEMQTWAKDLAKNANLV